MKIIKQPDWKNGGHIRCECGCVFEYSGDDVRLRGFSQLSWPHVVCPICETGVPVSRIDRASRL